MIPLFLAAIAFAAFLVWQTGQLRFAAAPLGVLPLWSMLRFQIPRDGMAVTTIRSTPGAVIMLWFCSATIILMGVLFAIDIYVLGHPFHAPLKLYHLFMFGPLFVLLLVGAFFAERASKATRNQDSP